MASTDDILALRGYGKLLIGWKNGREVWRDPSAGRGHGPASAYDAQKFLHGTYGLVETQRPISIYRFAEKREKTDPNIRAPYGSAHASYQAGLAVKRNPSAVIGAWWSPTRPALLIDDLGYDSSHARDTRSQLAVLKEWNRFDFCVQATLQPGSLIYAGRTAPQSEDAAFEGRPMPYPGGGIQFLRVPGSTSVLLKRLYFIGTRLGRDLSQRVVLK